MASKKSVCLIDVNEEVLREFSDKDAKFLADNFTRLDYNVCKIVALEKNSRLLAQELINSSREYDIVLIKANLSDGVAYEALKLVFKQPLFTNKELINVLTDKKLSYTDEETRTPYINIVKGGDYPLLHLQRIFLINERYFDGVYPVLEKYFVDYQKTVHRKRALVYLNGNASRLENIGTNVTFDLKKTDDGLEMTYRSSSVDDLLQFETRLREIVHVGDNRPVLGGSVYRDPSPEVKQAIQIIEDCFVRYGPENVFISFNGGKDCMVLLHLMLVVLENRFPCRTRRPVCLYVQSRRPFAEQDEFIGRCERLFDLEITRIRAGIKEALKLILIEKPNLKACLMGTRRTDPFSQNLRPFEMTDKDYPEVMRVNPLLDWRYFQIWDYILYYKIPYCSLYDMGYTSLGDVDNTSKNPSLFYRDFDGERYLPAYKLLSEVEERSGRS